MSQFETKCPHCGAALSVQDEWIGMNVECPQCKQEFPVQDNPVRLTPAAAQTDNNGTFTFVCPACNAVAELPNSLLGQQYECKICFETATAQATTEKQCPYCGQTVKYHATVCKFCKADLTKAPPPSAPKPEETFVFICPECDTVEFLPVSMKGKQYECKRCCETSIAEPAEERKCPHCREKIKIKAAICKHCKKAVKPLTPPPAAEGGASQTLAGLKPRGANSFGGSRNPQTDPLPESGLVPAREKTLTKTMLWSLVWPGAGQIYLGQVGKGIVMILSLNALLIIPLPRLFIRLPFLILSAFIYADALGILTRLQMGDSMGKWEFCLSGRKRLLNLPPLPPDKQKSMKKASIILLTCLVLGLTGPGILGLITLIISIMS